MPSPMDGVALAVGQRVLVKNQTTASQNGIYGITATSSGTFTLNRATDADTPPPNRTAAAWSRSAAARQRRTSV
ncbi:MAG: hypothetical protein IPO15_04785 [Anaerolineae bacterium]|uniref:hypothetical protein n=1 Tax=Candidatus Amarolinea dominans TaxID=3140696 RepID=UPI0031351B4F|nr:hypothetical protein [Anaerolineae bacterium]